MLAKLSYTTDPTPFPQKEEVKEEAEERLEWPDSVESLKEVLQSPVTLTLELTWKGGGWKCWTRDTEQKNVKSEAGRREEWLGTKEGHL